ncbi:hypothetical protein [Sulfurimonas sp.]|uniref:hypothetical protein n=1 Tax=Sulfurimonas sp. TaxID=2022749 RepID=UPI002AB06CC8|nr:hypothetical protein [Sulfurimonas sp.]
MWLNNLQIAIIEKNTDNIDELLDNMPKFEKVKDMESASYLLREAAELIYTLQDETKIIMNKMEKNLKFLESIQLEPTNKLDLKS